MLAFIYKTRGGVFLYHHMLIIYAYNQNSPFLKKNSTSYRLKNLSTETRESRNIPYKLTLIYTRQIVALYTARNKAQRYHEVT